MHIARSLSLPDYGAGLKEISMSTSLNDYQSLKWRKAARSNPNGECMELARTSDGDVALRNSRDPSGPVLVFARAEIKDFLDGARKREFDDLTLRSLA